MAVIGRRWLLLLLQWHVIQSISTPHVCAVWRADTQRQKAAPLRANFVTVREQPTDTPHAKLTRTCKLRGQYRRTCTLVCGAGGIPPAPQTIAYWSTQQSLNTFKHKLKRIVSGNGEHHSVPLWRISDFDAVVVDLLT